MMKKREALQIFPLDDTIPQTKKEAKRKSNALKNLRRCFAKF